MFDKDLRKNIRKKQREREMERLENTNEIALNVKQKKCNKLSLL